ncbi:MAG: hypothetical protein IKO10_16010 [Lachnospiraceae bacterium]|nr:hypothetical protein [Lachnospiraceae bacterium]
MQKTRRDEQHKEWFYPSYYNKWEEKENGAYIFEAPVSASLFTEEEFFAAREYILQNEHRFEGCGKMWLNAPVGKDRLKYVDYDFTISEDSISPDKELHVHPVLTFSDPILEAGKPFIYGKNAYLAVSADKMVSIQSVNLDRWKDGKHRFIFPFDKSQKTNDFSKSDLCRKMNDWLEKEILLSNNRLVQWLIIDEAYHRLDAEKIFDNYNTLYKSLHRQWKKAEKRGDKHIRTDIMDTEEGQRFKELMGPRLTEKMAELYDELDKKGYLKLECFDGWLGNPPQELLDEEEGKENDLE